VLGLCLQGILERVDGLAEPEVTIYNVQLAAQEICTNIVDHAYDGQLGGRIAVAIAVAHDPPRLVVEVCDTGRSFDPGSVPAPNLEQAQVHGYGLFLVHSLMDDVSYEALQPGNRWRLVKNLNR
jgi:serine/threonine-protein kinase RsbW